MPFLCFSQLGGQSSYQALNLATNPRAAAVGGSAITFADGDVSQFFENPAVLDSVNAGNLFFHINPYFSDVSIYSVAYSFDVKEMSGFAAGLHYVNLGSFTLMDETGVELGTFQANDYVFTLGKAHQLGPFTLGANLKFAHSRIDSYSSSAIMADLGGVFRISKNWTVGMVMENMGARLSNYTALSSPPIPFDVKIGTSFKPQYMPLRFTLTSNNLVNRNEGLEEDSNVRSNSAVNNVLKRINIGAELLLSDNLQLLFGYNHKRKQELRLDEIGGGAGLSYGIMFKIKRFQFRFSRATYHAAGGSSFISLQTNLKEYKKIL